MKRIGLLEIVMFTVYSLFLSALFCAGTLSECTPSSRDKACARCEYIHHMTDYIEDIGKVFIGRPDI